MTTYVEVESSGQVLKVEIEPIEISGEASVSLESASSRLKSSLDDAMDLIKTCGQSFIRTLTTISEPPTESSVEFGLKIDAEAGALVAKASTEAHFKVTLRWKRQETAGAVDDSES